MPMDPVTGAIIGGTISGAGNIAGGIFGKKKERKFRKEMAEYAYGKDLEMWNRQNIYNMPSAQMARLKQAGLNPNLVYGTGTVTGNVQGQMPKYNVPQLDYEIRAPQIAENLQTFSDFAMKQAQTKNVDADTIKKLVEAKVAGATQDPRIMLTRYQEEMANLKTIQEREKAQYYKPAAEAEIEKSQMGAKRAGLDVEMRTIELQLYETLKKVGIGSTAGRAINAILRTLFMKK
ncbi:hypothetical protein ES705_27904 [subsurface metagenome]